MESLTKIRNSLPGMELDAILLTTPESFYYCTTTAVATQKLIPDRLALALISQDPEQDRLIVCSIEERQIRQESTIKNLALYSEFVDTPIEVAAKVVSSMSPAVRRLGVEFAGLRPEWFAELEQKLDGATLHGVDEFLERQRSIKSKSELATMQDGARITDQAISDVLSSVDEHWTEIEVVRSLRQTVEQGGAAGTAFCTLAAGRRANQAHPEPSNEKLGQPTTIRTDFGAYFGTSLVGYMSDLARTKALGQPSKQLVEAYDKLFDTHLQTLDVLGPGVAAEKVYRTVETLFEERGLAMLVSHVGHGIGLRVHEYPMLRPGNEARLEEGMVLSVEPIAMVDDVFLQIEDMVEITANGYRLLSDPKPWSSLV